MPALLRLDRAGFESQSTPLKHTASQSKKATPYIPMPKGRGFTANLIKHFTDSGAVVILVEIGFNRRELVYAESGLDGTVANCGIHGEFRHKYIGLHSREELWLKEKC